MEVELHHIVLLIWYHKINYTDDGDICIKYNQKYARNDKKNIEQKGDTGQIFIFFTILHSADKQPY